MSLRLKSDFVAEIDGALDLWFDVRAGDRRLHLLCVFLEESSPAVLPVYILSILYAVRLVSR